jgi:hypothetical protein
MLEDDTTEYKLAIGSQIDVKLDGKTVNIIANNGDGGFYAIDDSTVVDGVTTYKTVVATASVVDDTGKTVFFDNLEDATFSRNFLLEHDWDVNAFGEIEFCDETDTYKIVEVFDDRIYILASYETLAEAEKNLKNAKSEFLNKIFKHKNGLANYPHLDILTDRIDELENDFQLKTQDDFWNIGDVENPLEDIIFNLTPWQKIIYDNAGDEFTFQQLKVKLKRYESKNFDKKIQRYLDELQELNLIEKLDDDVYRKI